MVKSVISCYKFREHHIYCVSFSVWCLLIFPLWLFIKFHISAIAFSLILIVFSTLFCLTQTFTVSKLSMVPLCANKIQYPGDSPRGLTQPISYSFSWFSPRLPPHPLDSSNMAFWPVSNILLYQDFLQLGFLWVSFC